MRELHLHLTKSLLAFTSFFFRPLPLGQVEYETDTLIRPSLECRATNQHRHAATVLTEILLLVRLVGRSYPYRGALGTITPFRRRQFPPIQVASQEILSRISHYAEKGVVSISDPTISIPYDDADDVRIDQPSYPRVPILQIIIEADVFQ